MPITEEPLHPAIAAADEARESFLTQASESIETARTARLNPLSEKLSAAPAEKAPTPTPPSPSKPETKPEAAKIPGPPTPPEEPGKKPPGETVADAASPELPAIDESGVPGPEEYRGGKGFAERWQKLHSLKDEWKQVASNLSKELTKLKEEKIKPAAGPDPEISKRIETLQSERDNLLARLEAVAVERSPRFEAAFKPREEAAVAQAKAAVGPDRAKRIEEILSLPESTYRDEQLDAVLSELGTGVRGAKLAQAVADLDRVKAERQALASRGSDLFKQWQSEEQAAYQKQQKEREDHASKVFTDELATWRNAGYLKNDQEIELAKSVFSGQADFTDAARASIWAVVGPQLAGQAMAAKQRVGELEAELAKFRAVQPSPTGGTDSKIEPEDEMPKDLSYSDAIARMVQQGGLLR